MVKKLSSLEEVLLLFFPLYFIEFNLCINMHTFFPYENLQLQLHRTSKWRWTLFWQQKPFSYELCACILLSDQSICCLCLFVLFKEGCIWVLEWV